MGLLISGADDSSCSEDIFEALSMYSKKASRPLYAMSIVRDQHFKLTKKLIIPIVVHVFDPKLEKDIKTTRYITLWCAPFLKNNQIIFGKDIMKTIGISLEGALVDKPILKLFF